MPTYKNNSSQPIVVKGGPNGGDIWFQAWQEIGTEFILDDVRLTFISEAPHYNPLVGEYFFTMASSAASGYYDIDTSTKYVRLVPVTGSPTVRINSLGNTPGLRITEAITLENSGRIERLYLLNETGGSVTIDIKQLNNIGQMSKPVS